jgi:hypothetical protein
LICQSCTTHSDSNTHVSLCHTHLTALQQIFPKIKSLLFTLIENNATGLTFDLLERINRSSLFNLDHTSESRLIPLTHPFLLLIYNIIPTELGQFFYNYVGNGKSRDRTFITFLSEVYNSINQIVWYSHIDNTKKWEKSLRITKNKKKFYRRNHKNNEQNNITRRRNRISRDSFNPNSTSALTSYLQRRPYYKYNPTFDDQAHIRWTSSNFLHSGHWKIIETNYFFLTI